MIFKTLLLQGVYCQITFRVAHDKYFFLMKLLHCTIIQRKFRYVDGKFLYFYIYFETL